MVQGLSLKLFCIGFMKNVLEFNLFLFVFMYPIYQISSAASLNELHMLIDKYASLLQTAGCFDYPQSVEGKDNIVKDFIQWYILYRNQYSIQR